MPNTRADIPTLIQTSLAPDLAATPPAASKLGTIISLLQRPRGAAIAELAAATSWQQHSIRGAISGALKHKHHLDISSTAVEGRGRVYRLETPQNAQISLVEAVSTCDVGGPS